MRRMIFLLVSLAIIGTSQAQSKGETAPEISVSATSSVSAQPDLAEFRISIIARNPQATAAFKTYLRTYNILLKSLTSAAVDSNKLMTDNLSIRPFFNYKKPDRVSPEYYQATASMSLSVPIADLNKLLGSITAVEGLTIDGIQFRVKDSHRLEIKALKLADRQARMKAEAIAGLEGLTDLKVKSMNTSTVPPPILPMNRMMSVQSEAPSLSAPPISVSATVHVTYTAVQK